MAEQLEQWAGRGVGMHFSGRIPAALADQPGKQITADLVGAADPAEVTIMNGLTVNLHLLLLAFYRPKGHRTKILIEDHAFPSDRYAVRSVLRLAGAGDGEMVSIRPRPGEDTLRTEDILDAVAREGEQLAVLLLSGVQYYTGQKFDMAAITAAGRQAGAVVGWDLAHAVGNVELRLNEWQVGGPAKSASYHDIRR